MSDRKRIFMAGVGGMLGEAFHRVFKDAYTLKCTDIDLNEEWLEYCDFRDYQEYRRQVFEFKPDLLFHIGAYTDLEFCEQNADETYLTNTLSVENAVNIANDLDVPVLYISTAGIFDGKKSFYDDWDTPNPMGVYARSKYMGERFVLENARKYLICRAGWMMGGGEKKDKKFINKLIKQITSGKKILHIVDDKLGTPTYTMDFASNVKVLVENEQWGLYNMVCEGVTSRLEVATTLIQLLNRNDITIQAVPSDYFQQDYFAPRPANERLINKKLMLRKMNVMQHWEVALTKYIKEYYHNYIS